MKYHKIEVKINTNHKASYFTGSMLRGAMGYALKKVTCLNSSTQTGKCLAHTSCLYCQFYETSNGFHKYRFDIELGTGKFDFRLYLFDDACDGLPYVLIALEMMLNKIGLSKENFTFSELEFFLNGKRIYENKNFTFIEIPVNTFQADSFCPNVKLRLLTPLRIKKNNKFLRDDVDLEDILRSVYQREQEIFYGNKVFKLNYEPKVEAELKLLKHQELVRKSNRQKQTMNMDGVMGEMALMGLDKESYRLLKLGEIIAVGKQTVMGLGKIEVIDL